MNKLFVFWFLFCCCFTPGLFRSILRVVNGTDVLPGEFPFTVSLRVWSLQLYEVHNCGGSIISTTFVLTAGHCLVDQLIFVRIGSVDLDDFSLDRTYSHAIKKVYLYPDYYVDLNSVNDLALVELVEPITFSGTVQPVQLPDLNTSTIPFGQEAWITGWGMTNESLLEPSPNLQKAKLTLFEDDYCSSQLGLDYLEDKNFCAGNVDNSKGHCSGDSGGPLTINGVQWGVVSWSIKPCISAPGVYTRLSNPDYRSWIREITGV